MNNNADVSEAHVKQLALTAIARGIYELARHETGELQLKNLKKLAAAAASVFDNYENTIGPDLGTNLVEFVMLRLDGATDKPSGYAPSPSSIEYERVISTMLKELGNNQ